MGHIFRLAKGTLFIWVRLTYVYPSLLLRNCGCDGYKKQWKSLEKNIEKVDFVNGFVNG